jgi:formate dehydrogenase alpha subunit
LSATGDMIYNLEQMDERRVLTNCIWCGTGCSFYLRIRNGRIVGVAPSFAHPISRGRLCAKGWKSYEFAGHQDRLKKPLIREGDGFRESSWDEALDLIAERLIEIKNRYGPESIQVLGSAKCPNEDNYILQRWARACLGTDNIDHCARLCHASTVAGLARSFGSGAMTQSIQEIEDADLIFITGSNTAEQHPVIASHMMRAINRGAKLLVIDPRKTPMARIADIYLSPRPGTDIAWINAFINVIVNENLHDQRFIDEHTEGFSEMWAKAKAYTPEVAERITGIPAELIADSARLYASSERPMIFYSMGITQHITGTENVMSLANLVMVAGKIGRPSVGLCPLRGQNNVQGSCDSGVLPGTLPGYQPNSDEEVLRKFESLWGVRPPSWKGITSTQGPDAILLGSIKALYSMGENIFASHPDMTHMGEALRRTEFLVVQDIFLTETARFAHVVLPATAWPEKEGTFVCTDRTVQRVRKAVDPPGEARDDWRIIQELSKRMGYEMDFESPGEIFSEMTRAMPIYAGMSYERLEKGGLQWPCPSTDHPGTPYLHKDGNFSRPGGKGKFHPTEHVEPPELPASEYPFYLSTGRVSFHWHTRSMTGRIGILEREYPVSLVDVNTDDGKRLGIRSGDKVKITSRRGSIVCTARLTDEVPSGLIFATFHYSEASANLLTMNALDPVALIPELKVSAVKLEKEA